MLMPNSSFSILALDGRLHPAAPLKREIFSPFLYTPATALCLKTGNCTASAVCAESGIQHSMRLIGQPNTLKEQEIIAYFIPLKGHTKRTLLHDTQA